MQLSPTRALEIASQDLVPSLDLPVLRSLLSIAADQPAVAHQVSQEQAERLSQARILSLVPIDWASERETFRKRRRGQAQRHLHILKIAAMTLERFAEHNIECRVLKGVATSDLDYGRSSQRSFVDVDLLVHRRDLDRAVKILDGTPSSIARGGHRFGKGVTVTLGGVGIDIHYRLSRFGILDADILFDEPVALQQLQGGLAMPPELRLLHAASHLLLTPPGTRRLSGLADIAAINARNEIDVDKVQRLAAAMNAQTLTNLALRIEQAIRQLPLSDEGPPLSWLDRQSFARADRRVIMEHVLAMASLDRPTDRAIYLRDWIVPTREQLAERGGLQSYYGRLIPSRLRRAKTD